MTVWETVYEYSRFLVLLACVLRVIVHSLVTGWFMGKSKHITRKRPNTNAKVLRG